MPPPDPPRAPHEAGPPYRSRTDTPRKPACLVHTPDPRREATQAANAHTADMCASHTPATRHARSASSRRGRAESARDRACLPAASCMRAHARSRCTHARRLRERDVAASRRPSSARARRRAARGGAHGQQRASLKRCQLRPHNVEGGGEPTHEGGLVEADRRLAAALVPQLTVQRRPARDREDEPHTAIANLWRRRWKHVFLAHVARSARREHAARARGQAAGPRGLARDVRQALGRALPPPLDSSRHRRNESHIT